MIYEAEVQSSFLVRFGAAAEWKGPLRFAGTPQHNDRILADVILITEARAVILEFKRTEERYQTEWRKSVKRKLLHLLDTGHHLRPASDVGHWLVAIKQERGATDHVLDQYAATLRQRCYADEPEPCRITFAEFVERVHSNQVGMTVREFASYVQLLSELGGGGKVKDVAGLLIDASSGVVELRVGAGVRQLLEWARRSERAQRFTGRVVGSSPHLGQ